MYNDQGIEALRNTGVKYYSKWHYLIQKWPQRFLFSLKTRKKLARQQWELNITSNGILNRGVLEQRKCAAVLVVYKW